MDEHQKADVIELFAKMQRLDGERVLRQKKKSNHPGSTTIIDSTVVICWSAEIADLLRVIAGKSAQ